MVVCEWFRNLSRGAPWVRKFGYIDMHPRNLGSDKIAGTYVEMVFFLL